jgi:hypothetical protein
MKTVELSEDYIDLVIRIMIEKRDELEVLLKNPEGLGENTIKEIQLEHRDLNNVVRELKYYCICIDVTDSKSQQEAQK